MSAEQRFERDLPTGLVELAAERYPEYLDGLAGRVGAIPQRPAWTFPERWLPMALVQRQQVVPPPLPWRTIRLAVVFALLVVVAGVSVYVGSQPRLPAPFGPARNGFLAYARAGDIYLVDPVLGTSTPLTEGPTSDQRPGFSPDGTKVAFVRMAGPSSEVWVADVSGGEPRKLTDQPLLDLQGGEWSGNGKQIVVASTIGGRQTMSIIDAEGGGVRGLDVGMPISGPVFRPVDGNEIAFVGHADDGDSIFTIDADGTGQARRLAGPYAEAEWPAWSPDGERLAFTIADASERHQVQIVDADGTDGRTLPLVAVPDLDQWWPGDAVESQGWPRWSPDGADLLVTRWYARPGYAPESLEVIIPVDGDATPTSIGPMFNNGELAQWSPDGLSILYGSGIVEIATARWTETPYAQTTEASWQRLAPD